MSDELQRWLHRPGRNRPVVIDPSFRTSPRVQGGQPLEGGPQLQIDLAVAQPPRSAAAQPAAPAPPAANDRSPQTVDAAGRLPPVLPSEQCPMPEPSFAPPPQTDTSPPVDRPLARATDHLLVAVDLKKSFQKGPVEIPVLKGVSLGVRQGEFLAVVGQSGSGKSTLLHLLGTLDSPDAGEIHFVGQRIDRLPPAQRDLFRSRHLGMIFQFYHLLPELNTLENVLVPLMVADSGMGYLRHRRQRRQAAIQLLEKVGLGHRLRHKPRELSGGEMQRVAIARALIAGPDLLLADEPTGNLDHATGRGILDVLVEFNRHHGLTIVMVTHDPTVAEQAHRVVRLADGQIEG